MKKGIFAKIALIATLAAAISIVPAFSGCIGLNGRDGVNGKDLTIYDIWQETKERTGNPDLSFEDFLREYLSYNSEQLEQSTSLTAAINRSLLSGVSIIATFDEYVRSGFMGSSYSVVETSYYGSGVIMDVDKSSGDMTVLTNCHVVYSADAKRNNAGNVEISTSNGFAKSVQLWLYGSEYEDRNAIEATVIAASKSYDIAVLQVSANDLVKNSYALAAQWCNFEECYVGEQVYTVGNADGKKLSASVGYISKDSEEITVNMGSDSSPEAFEYRVLRTDTAINGGNSGGGLFNKYGQLVGIVNAKTISEDIDNMGYALAPATTRRVVQRMIEDADGTYGIETVSAGFNYASTDSYTTGLNIDGYAEIKEVVTVTRGQSFGKFDAGDKIVHVVVKRGEKVLESMPVMRVHNLTDALLSVKAGDTVIYTVERGGENVAITVTYTSGDYIRKM